MILSYATTLITFFCIFLSSSIVHGGHFLSSHIKNDAMNLKELYLKYNRRALKPLDQIDFSNFSLTRQEELLDDLEEYTELLQRTQVFGRTADQIKIIQSGFSRTAISREEKYPNLVFKIPTFSRYAEPVSRDEFIKMENIAKKAGYQTVVIDGIKLTKIPGVAPFAYAFIKNRLIVIQQKVTMTNDEKRILEAKNILRKHGIIWQGGQLKNMGLIQEMQAGVLKWVPVVIDNKELRIGRFLEKPPYSSA